MRSLLLLVIALGACDLQPPPKKAPKLASSQPAPAAEPTPTNVPPAPPVDTPPSAQPDAGVAAVVVDAAAPTAPPDAFETTAACNEVAVKIAASIIDNAQDPAQKAALIQERDRMVRRVAEACTRDKWPEASRKCFLTAKTPDEMQICGKDLAAPRDE